MPPGTLLQLLVGIVALALLWTTWWLKRNDDRKKTQDDIDKKIDEAKSFDDFVRLDDQLRGK